MTTTNANSLTTTKDPTTVAEEETIKSTTSTMTTAKEEADSTTKPTALAAEKEDATISTTPTVATTVITNEPATKEAIIIAAEKEETTSSTISSAATTTVKTAASTKNTASTTTINCHEDNGGCSHYCQNSKCECPPCWTISEDNINCIIDHSKIHVKCSVHGFDIEVHQCVFTGESEDVVKIGFKGMEEHHNKQDGSQQDDSQQSDVLDMESCTTMKVRNGVHGLQIPLESCGTNISYTDDKQLSFNNILKVFSRVSSNGLLFNNDVKVPGTEYYKSTDSIKRTLIGST